MKPILSLMFLFITTAASSMAATFDISCKELMDLATYEPYFAKRVVLQPGEDRLFKLMTHFPDDDHYTLVSFKLNHISTEAIMAVTWSTFYQGKFIESHSDELAIADETTIDLWTNSYNYLFRNSCTINYLPQDN